MQNGNTNWNSLYQSAQSAGLRNFMQKISPIDLNNMTLLEAKNYVLTGFINTRPENNKDMIAEVKKLTKNENALKFELHASGEQETIDFKDFDIAANKLISGQCADGQKVQGLQLKTSGVIIKQISELPNKLSKFINFNSVSLPRRSVLLDSRNKNMVSNGDLNWNLLSFNSNKLGNVNTQSELQQIVSISCNSFKFPIPVNILQNVNFYKKIRIGIAEFNNQGIELINNNFYHIDCAAEQVGNYLECTPLADWKPHKVIAQLSKITLNFYGNTELITLDQDRMLASYIAGNPTVFTVDSPHGLSTGDLVYVESGELQNKQGYIIAVLSATTFEISATSILNGQTQVFFASKRLQIQLNFICLE